MIYFLAHFQAKVYSYVFHTQKYGLYTITIWGITQIFKLKLMLVHIVGWPYHWKKRGRVSVFFANPQNEIF